MVVADLTPKHVRAARALLAWSQQDLAKEAGVATSTVADFERGKRTPVANNAQAIRTALESSGIRFLPTGAVAGPPIPGIASPASPGVPLRWVTAEDISSWADRLDGAASLPTLLAKLIFAAHGPAITLRFPSDEGIRHGGWDGHTVASQASAFVPLGETAWELSTQRTGIAQKATKDYDKRTEDPAGVDPGSSTYISVSTRSCPQKVTWAKTRKTNGPWRDVRFYDVHDLVHWIEQTPAVGLWLATRLGKRPPGTRELEEVWEEWSLATRWPLSEDLILGDRDADSVETLRWLRGAPSVLSLQATTTDEGVAFFHATLGMLPEQAAEYYRTRCVVVTDASAARMLGAGPSSLILVLTEPDPGLARSLVERGHFVVQVYDDRPITRGDVRKLSRPSRESLASALTNAGVPENEAHALARDSARNVAVLRRLMPSAPGRVPLWAQAPPSRALVAALLVGGWDEEFEGDKAKIAELAGDPYDKVVGALASYVGGFDRPLRQIGSAWRIASPLDAWFLLGPYLTTADIARFEAIAYEVLGSEDPRYDMNPSDRWVASIRGVRPRYSGLLRHGVGKLLILLALRGENVVAMPNAAGRADAIVARLLDNADRRRWWSLSHEFRLLAEASPDAFLTAIENSLDQADPPIRALFGSDGDGVFDAEHLSDLLWGLESLGWSPEYLPRVSLVLARLDAIDPGGRYSNRPANSLWQMHCLWAPQTFANLEQRLRVIELIRKQEGDAAWRLLLRLLPGQHDAVNNAETPRWRDFSVETNEAVTWPLIGRGATAISERLLADVGTHVERWLDLIDRLPNIVPDPRLALAALDAAQAQITVDVDRAALEARVRKLLHLHRQFPDAEWVMPPDVLDELERVYARLAPADPLRQVAWLFAGYVELPNPPPAPATLSRDKDVDRARQDAVRGIFELYGEEGILRLARLAEMPGYVGKALVETKLGSSDLERVLEAALKYDDAAERNLARGVIATAFENRKKWIQRFVARVQKERWNESALLTTILALPPKRWAWTLAANAGEQIEELYWRRMIAWEKYAGDELDFAVRKLIAVGRARDSLHLVDRANKSELSSDLLVEVLRQSVPQPESDPTSGNVAVLFQHYVVELLKRLDERDDVSAETIAGLEWMYLPLLERSRRPATALLKALSEEPRLFVEMLSAVFKRSEENSVADPAPADPARAQAIARQAYRLLEICDRVPGTNADGTIDEAALESWIREARSLAKAAGRAEIADSRIGVILSASGTGSDGVWPAEAVRRAIDLFHSEAMMLGFCTGKQNRRGVTTRLPRSGGELERIEAARYRQWASAVRYEFPYTAKALDTLANRYENEALRHDEDAERLDWLD